MALPPHLANPKRHIWLGIFLLWRFLQVSFGLSPKDILTGYSVEDKQLYQDGCQHALLQCFYTREKQKRDRALCSWATQQSLRVAGNSPVFKCLRGVQGRLLGCQRKAGHSEFVWTGKIGANVDLKLN